MDWIIQCRLYLEASKLIGKRENTVSRTLLTAVWVCVLAGAVIAQGFRGAAKVAASVVNRLQAEYTVSVQNMAVRTLHVTAVFSGFREPYLDVALPRWTPGVYDAANYALNVRRFTAHDEAGKTLRVAKIQPSTWRLEADGSKKVTVEFNYRANQLSWNGAALMPTFAFFTGSQLFLEPVGYRDAPATVHFAAPDGWKIASVLHETTDPSI